jgi:hypothetical protein
VGIDELRRQEWQGAAAQRCSGDGADRGRRRGKKAAGVVGVGSGVGDRGLARSGGAE